jgi:arylsulfatase A-like enzyme
MLRLWSDLTPKWSRPSEFGDWPDRPLLELRFGEGAQGETPELYRVVDSEEPQRLDLQPLPWPQDELILRKEQGYAVAVPLAVLPGEALSVRVTARVLGEPGPHELPVAAVVELRHPFRAESGMGVADIPRLFDPDRGLTHTLAAGFTSDPAELRTDFVADWYTRQLAIYLVAPRGEQPEALAVQSLSVVRRTLAAHVAVGGSFPRLERTGMRGPAALTLHHERREGILALPGARFEFDLPADDRPRRLDLSLGCAPRDPALLGAIIARVEVDGVLLHEERLTAPADGRQPAWNDLVLPLPAGARQLKLSADGNGPDPPLAMFGNPRLRAAEPASRPNVVLISLDTLRPDRLGCYGGDPGLSPRMDGLAASGLLFSEAYSTSSYTLPSHGSMLTGQYPAVHGAVDITDELDPGHSPFLASMLAEAGYVTAAFTGGGYVSADLGFGTGFDRYSHNDPVWALDGVRGRQLLETVSRLLIPVRVPVLARYGTPMITEWIERQDDGVPFFLFLHTYIVHNYAPDLARLEKHGLLDEQGREQPFNHQDRTKFNEGELALRDTVYEQYMPYYDATIEMADEFVGEVLDALERAGLDENTLVIVTSDHGEEFGEHAFFGHGESLYDDNTRIPLIVRLPAGAPGAGKAAVVDDLVSLVDLAPWILRLAGLEPDRRMAVAPPLGPERGMPPGRSRLFIELDTRVNRLSAVRHEDLKLHLLLEGTARGLDPGQALLFDLARDPAELGALQDGEAEARLRDAIDGFHRLTEAIHPRDKGPPAEPSTLDPDVQAALQALGYLEAPER